MIHRRAFLKSAGAAAGAPILSAAVTTERIAAATQSVATLSPDEAARNEDYWLEVQQAFTVSRSIINLNSAGVSPSPRIVTDAVVHYTWEQEKLPSYTLFSTIAPRLETVRVGLAKMFGCDAEEVAVVRNATEALQTVLLGVGLKAGDEVLTTTQDYWAMLDALEQRRQRDGIVVTKLKVPTPPGSLDDLAKVFEQAVTPRTKLILVSHPVNLTGQHFPIKRICEIAHRQGIEVCVDGAQSFAQLDFKHSDLDCDYFGTSLHKWLMAPKVTGMLYVRREKIARLWPLLPAPDRLKNDVRKFEYSGTGSSAPLAIAEAIAFHHGIGGQRKAARLRYLTGYWVEQLKSLPSVRFHTSFAPEMSSAIATVEIAGVNSYPLFDYLWNKHQIHAYNVARRTSEFQGIRVSPNLHTTLQELDYFCEVMRRVAKNGLPKSA
ncbi:MAG: aminotransferase class V-fold PLP-dependent enzyme [Blastocatellia bacterium]